MISRRRVLPAIGLAPLAIAAPGPQAARVIVTGLEIFPVHVNARGNWILVRLQSSAGVTGIGEASHGGRDQATIELMRLFFDVLKGRSVYDVEPLLAAAEPEVLKGGSVAAVALSGLEQCLWDIRGKLAGVPVCDLLGGRINSKLRNYANINRSVEDRSPEGFARMAERAVAAGFDAVKLAPWDDMPRNLSDPRVDAITDLGIARATAVRKTIGDSVDLLLDCHSHFNLSRGLQLARRLESLVLYWLEEVTPAEPLSNLAAINREAAMPTAGGELIHGVRGFYHYIAGNAVDIVMPDVKYCGGVLELKKIAAIAEGAGVPVAPHGPASPVGNLVAGHVCATLPNFNILEHAYGEVPWRAEVVDPPEPMDKGSLQLSELPGYGVRLNEKTLAKYRAD